MMERSDLPSRELSSRLNVHCLFFVAVGLIAQFAFFKAQEPCVGELQNGLGSSVLQVGQRILPNIEDFQNFRNQPDGNGIRFADDPIDQTAPRTEIGRPTEHVGDGQVVYALDRAFDVAENIGARDGVLRLKPDQHLLKQRKIVSLKQRGKLRFGVLECGREWRSRQPLALPLPPEILARKRVVSGAPAPVIRERFLSHETHNAAQQGRLPCVFQCVSSNRLRARSEAGRTPIQKRCRG